MLNLLRLLVLRLRKLLIKGLDIYHDSFWNPIAKYFRKYKVIRKLEGYFRISLRILNVFNIMSPPPGQQDCYFWIIFRHPTNKFNKLTFKQKLTYLKSFIKRTIK